MAGPVAIVAAVFSAASTVYSAMEQSKAKEEAGREANRLAGLNAASQEAETAEEARRLKATQEQSEALSRAKAAASGMTLDGSLGGYLEDMKTENALELEWLKKSGATRAGITRETGASAQRTAEAEASGIRSSGYFSAAAGAGKTVAGNWGDISDWWKKP